MTALYARALMNGAGDGQASHAGPNGHTLTYPELLSGLQKTYVIIGAFQAYNGVEYNAFTDIRTSNSMIYIDPNKLGDYVAEFGEHMALNYAVYHELAHALPDGRADASNPNREAITNEYGQLLASLGNALYPTDTQLERVGGWVTR